MTNVAPNLLTEELKTDKDYLAPDGSEIRLLLTMRGGGLAHCTLPAGKTTSPKVHRQVEEIWYIIEGQGEVWRKNAEAEVSVRVQPGTCLTIPPGTAFQFRNTGTLPLCIVIATIPPWPGPQEAQDAVGAWPATATASTE